MVDAVLIEGWCSAGRLPEHDEFFAALVEDSGQFTDVEGQFWDFKDQWPFSYSDAYFAGICRLICALANSMGGVIVFGVNDVTREGGRNKVRPNIDRLIKSFDQLTGRKFEMDFRSYAGSSPNKAVDVLLVLPRPRNTKPITFSKSIDVYPEKVIWVRSGHEVVKAEPHHYASLFASRKSDGLDGSIPPSTSQIKKFIGRVEAMSELFDWLQNSDEPRTYLYGKGGSGKTTIAREFARLVKTVGADIQIEEKNGIDIVLFVSAKERALSSADAQIITLDEPDFYDEASLLQRIILLSGGDLDMESTGDGGLKAYRRVVSEYLNAFSYLIVIDDIDTLTTKGIDPGADFLYRALIEARKKSKVLYTTRNAPSQSIHNSVEVPGLIGDEYRQFVKECVVKFKTAEPSSDFLDNRLPQLSERRPLVIEAIVALSRTSGGLTEQNAYFYRILAMILEVMFSLVNGTHCQAA